MQPQAIQAGWNNVIVSNIKYLCTIKYIHVLSSTLSSVQGKGLMTTHWLEGEADQVPDLGLVTSRCDEAESED